MPDSGSIFMDMVFWISVLLGGSIGFVASVLANFSTPALRSLFERSKLGWLERSKKRALKSFQFIIKFRNGSEDRYMYFVAQWGYILFYAMQSLVGLLLLSLTKGGAIRYFIAFWMVLTLLRGTYIHLRLYIWYWRINNFSEYKASLNRRWPDLKL